jgi:branched-chain amino acid transport system permease protein
MALKAVRDSEPASRTLGLSILQLKVIVGALGAFVAAIGGGFIALDAGVAQPASYETFAGLVWLAVVVTIGVRSIAAAVLGGLAFALLPGVFQSYVPPRLGEVPALLFGLGAVMVARNPEGLVSQFGRRASQVLSTALRRKGLPEAISPPPRTDLPPPVVEEPRGVNPSLAVSELWLVRPNLSPSNGVTPPDPGKRAGATS